MKIYSIILFENDNIISEAYNLSSFGFFQRQSVKEFIIFFSNFTINRIALHQRNCIKNNEYMIYAFKNQYNSCCIICDIEYYNNAAFNIIYDVLDKKYNTGKLEQLIIKYQNPNETNKIYNLQCELKSIENTLNITINNLLIRGEKLDILVEKSNILSNQSKEFFNKANEHNCCFVS